MTPRQAQTLMARIIPRSMGNWRYPYMLFSWWISGILAPRRKIAVGDVTFTLSCSNWITHFRWYLFKSKEPEIRCYIDEYVTDGDVFFDIGANVGVFSIYAAKRHPGISVYCFEPEYSNLHALKENVIHNGLMSRINIFSVGISDYGGLSTLFLQDLTTGSACHTESKEAIRVTADGQSVVWSEGIFSVTLDDICEHLGVIPNTVKIDTDGDESRILKGAANTLMNPTLKSLVFEAPKDEIKRKHCYEFLESAGFSAVPQDVPNAVNEIWARRKVRKH